MNKQTAQTQSVKVQSQSPTKSKNANPRKAATNVKEINNHVQIMRKRLQALQVQQDYNRFKTVEHQQRINHHQSIHSHILKQREVLRKSLQQAKDVSEAKEKTEQLRLQIREKIKQARKSVIQDRVQRTQLISQESSKHEKLIKQQKTKDVEQNRQIKKTVQSYQEKARLSISRHVVSKLKNIKENKSIDTGILNRKSEQSQNELSRLIAYQQKLLHKNAESLQASTVMRHKYNKIFTVSTQNSSMLPQISVKSSTSKQNNSKQLTL